MLHFGTGLHPRCHIIAASNPSFHLGFQACSRTCQLCVSLALLKGREETLLQFGNSRRGLTETSRRRSSVPGPGAWLEGSSGESDLFPDVERNVPSYSCWFCFLSHFNSGGRRFQTPSVPLSLREKFACLQSVVPDDARDGLGRFQSPRHVFLSS